MIRSCLFAVVWCAAALAQLPAPQAPPPRFDEPAKSRTRKLPPPMKTPWRVDAIATGPDGRPVSDLTAADFDVLTGDKPQKATAAEFQGSAPLRIAVVVDDLSLSPENLAGLQKTLHEFVSAQVRPGDEAAILCTSESNGRADQFTSDQPALTAAIDRLRSNRPADDSPLAFTTGSIGALRSAVLGLQFTSGRKLAIFLSERLRSADRTPDPTWTSRLVTSANRSSVVLYAVDVASNADPSYVLAQGLAGAAPETGGAFFDAVGDPGAALARIAESQRCYYILRFETEPLQRITPLAVKTQRPGVQARARNGVLGLAGDGDGRGFVAPENELRAAVGTALFATGLHLDLTAKPGTSAAHSLETVLHLNANEVTLTLRADGKYHGELDAVTALFQENDAAVSQSTRTVILQLTPEERQLAIRSGLAFSVSLPAPKKGPYQLRAAVLDDTGGRLGAASRFLEVRDLTLPPLTMAAIQLEPAGDPPRPVYPPGQTVRYSYELANLRNDGANHAKVEITNQILREGRVIYVGEPKILDVGLAPQQSSARISGTVKLSAEVQPGTFTLTVTALDTLATGADRRSATQTIDFEIQP
jgi:VWFA-related protein